MKTHWKKLRNPDYIGAWSLDNGNDKTVIIEKVVKEMVKGEGGKEESCTIAYLKNEKPFIINATNAKMIQKIHNTPYIEDWAGKKITLYVSKTKLKGEDVECLRVRSSIQKNKLLPETETWSKAIQALKEKTVTIEQLEKNFDITIENKELLCKNLK